MFKVFLNVNDGVKKREKLTHEVAGPFQVKKVNKNNTVVIQRGDQVEVVTGNSLTQAPTSATAIEPDHATSTLELEEKNTEGKRYFFKKILDHRERTDGTLEFKLAWSGNWDPTWEPRPNVPEEAVSRYLNKVAREAKKKRSRRTTSA